MYKNNKYAARNFLSLEPQIESRETLVSKFKNT